MFGFHRLTMLAIIVLSGVLAGVTVGIAQSPTADPEPPAQQKIRKTLDGADSSESTDPILNDILGGPARAWQHS